MTTISLDPDETYNYRIVASGDIYKSSDEKSVPHHYYRPNPAQITSTSQGSKRGVSGPAKFGVEIGQKRPLFDFFAVKEAALHIEYKDGEEELVELIHRSLAEKRFEGEIPEREYYSTAESITKRDSIYDKENTVILSAEKTFEKEVEKISLHVVYENNTVHQGELWPHETYHHNIY